MKFQPNPTFPNEILQGPDFYISYNTSPGLGLAIWAADNNSPETALVISGEFYILNGDFREAYTNIAPQGKDACLKFYFQQAAHADSSWSTKLSTN